ncbi:MAG: rhomboid family intramembrane serine protease [Prevotella sp.]|nr:rhomboid family intramembrane serine protease [Prevotella sp.]
MFRNIPIVTRNLLIINVLVFLAQMIVGPVSDYQVDSITEWCGLRYIFSPGFHVYQFVTYMFLHGGFTHLFFNMFALWMFGCVIENVWGARKFLFYYIVCGIGAGITQEIVQFFTMPGGLTIGASGAIYGILLAFGMIFPNERIFIFPLPVPIKAKWFVVIYAALEVFMAVQASRSGSDGVAHVAHLGGMLFGFLLIRYWQRHPGNTFDLGRGRQSFQRWTRRTGSGGYSGSTRRYGGSGRSGSSANTGATWSANQTATRQDDMEYNARKQQRQQEVDAILDKIRKSGYDSLTKEEKQRLFEASRER